MGSAISEEPCDNATKCVPMVNVDKVKRQSNPAIIACRYHLESERSLQDDYKVSSEVLGQGLCGSVVVARDRMDGRRYAVKTLRKEGVQDNNKLLQVVAEVEIHLSMDHPNIAQVKDVYESETCISMVTECCEGGELYAALQEKGVYSNAEAAEATRQMLRVVRHLHARSIVHRDLKLENFLYKGKDPHIQMEKYLQESSDNSSPREAPQLKLIDFGFARVWDPSKLMMTACGSAEYVSPDVLCGDGYTNKADLWSIGVIVWMLLVGYPPFHGQKKAMMSKIRSARPDWSHESRWRNVNQDATDFLQKLLIKDADERMDAYTALQHPWITSTLPRMESSLACERTVCSMQRYVAGAKIRRAALQVFVQQLDWEQTHHFRELFFSMDQKSEGWISVEDFQCMIQSLEQTSNESLFQEGDFERPEDLFAALDTNGDQRIYYSEFMAATTSVCCQEHKHALKATFARLDADGSGSIGANDLCATLGKNFEGAAAAELLCEVHPLGDEIGLDDFLEALTVNLTFVEEVDVISPSKGRAGLFSTFSAISGSLGG